MSGRGTTEETVKFPDFPEVRRLYDPEKQPVCAGWHNISLCSDKPESFRLLAGSCVKPGVVAVKTQPDSD